MRMTQFGLDILLVEFHQRSSSPMSRVVQSFRARQRTGYGLTKSPLSPFTPRDWRVLVHVLTGLHGLRTRPCSAPLGLPNGSPLKTTSPAASSGCPPRMLSTLPSELKKLNRCIPNTNGMLESTDFR